MEIQLSSKLPWKFLVTACASQSRSFQAKQHHPKHILIIRNDLTGLGTFPIDYLNIPLCSSCQFCILSSHCSFVSLCCSKTLWIEIVIKLHWLSFHLLNFVFFKPCGTTYSWRNLNITSYRLLIFSPKSTSSEFQKEKHLENSMDSLSSWCSTQPYYNTSHTVACSNFH